MGTAGRTQSALIVDLQPGVSHVVFVTFSASRTVDRAVPHGRTCERTFAHNEPGIDLLQSSRAINDDLISLFRLHRKIVAPFNQPRKGLPAHWFVRRGRVQCRSTPRKSAQT